MSVQLRPPPCPGRFSRGAAGRVGRGPDARNPKRPVCPASDAGEGNAGKPRQMSENECRGQLVAVAGEIFLQKGYHATTMDAVAKSAGMSKKTVYQIFAAKSELFDALLIDWFGPSTLPVEVDRRSPREVLIGLLYRLVNFELSERQILSKRLVSLVGVGA